MLPEISPDQQIRRDVLGYPSNLTAAIYEIEKMESQAVAEEIQKIKKDNPNQRFIVIICYPSEMSNDCLEFVKSIYW